MARKERERIREQDITGLKYFDRLAPLLERLRDVGCERDRAGNRELYKRGRSSVRPTIGAAAVAGDHRPPPAWRVGTHIELREA
jgi:hypothetical protein